MAETPGGVVHHAKTLAREHHAGQVDKQGRDYAEHHLAPIAALLAPFGPAAEAAGWLHDIVEDTDVTVDDLRALGFPELVVGAVDSVTREPGEPYEDMIERAAGDRLGRLVKLMDNWHNLSSLDALPVPATVRRLRRRYEKARVRLLAAYGLDQSGGNGEAR